MPAQSGYYVRRRPARMVEATTLAGAPAPEPVAVGVSRRLVQVLRANEAPGMVRLGSALPAPELLLELDDELLLELDEDELLDELELLVGIAWVVAVRVTGVEALPLASIARRL